MSFFFPGLSLGVRQWYLPIHQLAGMVIFVMAVMYALMGLSERAAWHNTYALSRRPTRSYPTPTRSLQMLDEG